MRTKKGLLGYYNYTVVLTYCGLLTAFVGATQAVNGNAKTAVLCLMLVGGCDMFDGAVAATRPRMPAEKRFGIQIDSLSDLICFGLLPALLVYTNGTRDRVSVWVCGGYVLCGLIRLAYFNVMEEERQRTQAGPRTGYQGLPITSIALLLPPVYALDGGGLVPFAVSGPVLLCAVGIAFLLPFSVPKPDRAGKAALVVIGAGELALLLLRVR